jgi:hypothetical protein
VHLLFGVVHHPAHPLARDVVLSMISLDYEATIMAAAGHEDRFVWPPSPGHRSANRLL